MIEIPLHLRYHTARPGGSCEIVSGGVPLPAGLCWSMDDVAVVDSTGMHVPVQLAVLDHWPDGSFRWLSADIATDTSSSHRLRLFGGARPELLDAVVARADGDAVTVRAESRTFVVAPTDQLFETTDPAGQRLSATVIGTDASGTVTRAGFTTVAIERPGPVLAVVISEGTIALGASRLVVSARLRFSARSAVSIDLSILNPSAAVHTGNVWELGDRGSVLFKDLSIHLQLPSAATAIVCIAEAGAAPVTGAALMLYQDSSGGGNWRSTVHVNRDGRVPTRFNGYRLEGSARPVAGLRASPALQAAYDGGTVAATVRHFWQNFPKALEGDATGITIRLFPRQWDDLHELQGGERKTHTAALTFSGPPPQSLSPAQEPAVVAFEPEWYQRCEAVPSLIPSNDSVRPDYETLVQAALDGDDTLAAKRERIDEYGWRHFGDLYADHEAVGHRGDSPLVSHYNNQYDAVAGFAIQFMRSGDLRWFSAMEELAGHVTDIDLYHADRDKAAFTHGLFWHTAHYADAGRSTHRTYPRGAGVSGGPSNEHNYSTGLLLHHLLTGDERSRSGVLEMVNWVERMDDGRRTVFRFLSRGATGLASSTVTPDYHGPGRGAGNSIVTLLNGFRLTRDRRLLVTAESLIARCIHPADDIEARTLLDAERRWSYTVFLQALGKYLQVKHAIGEHDGSYAYARASLVSYGRWMAAHEYPYLDKPEILEYPNETWAAQDVRKAEIFAAVAEHGAAEAREQMLERSRYFFDRSMATLTASATRTLTRPVVILLSTGHNITRLQQRRSTVRNERDVKNFGTPKTFIPQKAIAMRRAVILAAVMAVTVVTATLYALLLYLA